MRRRANRVGILEVEQNTAGLCLVRAGLRRLDDHGETQLRRCLDRVFGTGDEALWNEGNPVRVEKPADLRASQPHVVRALEGPAHHLRSCFAVDVDRGHRAGGAAEPVRALGRASERAGGRLRVRERASRHLGCDEDRDDRLRR
jgi:hypothetical protein